MRKSFLALLTILAIGLFLPSQTRAETAIFAGGCFWCMHAEFEGEAGITKVTSGYTGGTVENPTYQQVSSGQTGHVEAIKIEFDPTKIAYEKLLDIFWSNVDPTDPDGQFCDQGSHYRAGIFYTTDQQQIAAKASVPAIEKKLGQKVATFLRPAVKFYAAEDYHQSYYRKNAIQYKLYAAGCGRERRLESLGIGR